MIIVAYLAGSITTYFLYREIIKDVVIAKRSKEVVDKLLDYLEENNFIIRVNDELVEVRGVNDESSG